MCHPDTADWYMDEVYGAGGSLAYCSSGTWILLLDSNSGKRLHIHEPKHSFHSVALIEY